MRILVLSNLFPPHVLGGYEIACRNVAVALRERKHEVRVLTSHSAVATGDEPSWIKRVMTLDAYGPSVLPTPERDNTTSYEACSQFSNTMTLLKELQDFQPDVVYVWNLYGIGGLALLDLLEQLGVPWLIHLMDNIPTHLCNYIAPLAASLFTREHRALFANANAIAMSQQILTELADMAGIRFENPRIVPGWVDATGLPQRETYNAPSTLRMINFGTLAEHKGTHLIIQATGDLLAEGYRDFHVDLFGIGAPHRWIGMTAQHGASRNITFRPALPHHEMLRTLANYDVFLFPTQSREPFGFTAIEAAACGVVPIITQNAGASERLVNHVHAIKIEPNRESLAAAMRQLLRGDFDISTIGRRAARFVRQSLSFGKWLNEIEHALRDVVHPWNLHRLNDNRLPAIVFAKHFLGKKLIARR
jgi:glycogen(starch) synthase